MSDALLWGIKSSLLTYVRSQGDGLIQATNGAEIIDLGGFRFPFLDRNDRVLRFVGGIRLQAHNGLLDIAVSDPWIELAPALAISMIAEWTGEPAERLTIARIGTIDAANGGWIGSSVRLTADGSTTLGALQYFEGQQVDDAVYYAPNP